MLPAAAGRVSADAASIVSPSRADYLAEITATRRDYHLDTERAVAGVRHVQPLINVAAAGIASVRAPVLAGLERLSGLSPCQAAGEPVEDGADRVTRMGRLPTSGDGGSGDRDRLHGNWWCRRCRFAFCMWSNPSACLPDDPAGGVLSVGFAGMSADPDVAVLRAGRAPGAWPGLGHVPALLRHPLRLLDSLPEHGDLVEIRLGRSPAFFLCHPDLARQVMTDFRSYDRIGPVYDRVRLAMGAGLATACREDHRRQRLIMQPAFRRQYLAGYAALMRQEIATMMSKWHDGQVLDMVEEMFSLTTGIALRALFSAQISPADAEELRTALDVFLRGTYTRAVLPIAAKLPVPANLRYARALASWRGQVQGLISESRRPGTDGNDLLSRLVRSSDGEEEGMSDRELSDQVAVLLLAGGETTSAAVVWALHLLNGHPQVMEALRGETDAVLGREAAAWEDLPRLELTARVIHEALRLYPPAWAILRTSVREARLADRIIPAGSTLVFSPYILHRRADLFPAPERFDPDRWLAPDGDRTMPHRASFLPFGAGAARCIGEDFGLAEATLILSSIAARWNFTLQAGVSVSAQARAVLAPKRFPVHLTER